jgi:iron complex outermembrane receptor protein
MSLSRPALLLAASISTLITSAAWAQTAPSGLGDILVTADRAQQPLLDRPAGTATGLDLSVLQLPASVDVVDLSALSLRGARTAADAARGSPGLTLSNRSGAPGVFSVRGFTENALATLYDGLRVQSSTLTARTYDPFHFDRIEILRGPGSLTIGEGATAGAINYIRRKPRLGDLRVEGVAEGGSQDRVRVGGAVSGGLTPAIGTTLSASYQTYDSFVESNRHQIVQVAGGLGGQIGERGGFLIEGDYLSTRVNDAYWGQPLVAGRVDPRIRTRNYNQSPTNKMADDVLWLRGVGTWAFSEALTYKGQVYYYKADRDWRNFAAFAYVAGPPEQAEVRNVEDLGYDHSLWGTRHELNARYNLGGIDVQSIVSVDHSDTDFSSPRRDGAPLGGVPARPRFSLTNPQPIDFASLTTPRLRQREADVSQTAIGWEQKLGLAPGVTLIGGLRHSWLDATIARPESTPAVAPFDVSLKALDWRIAATWQPVDTQSLYASFTSGSEPVESLLILPVTQANFRLTRTKGVEAGWKAQLLDKRLALSAAAFWMERDRMPSINPTNPNLDPQVGQQRSKGFEMSAAWTAGPLALDANLAYVDATFRQVNDFGAFRDGVRPANVPEWVLNGSVRYTVIEPLTVGGFVQHVGSRPSNNANVLFLDSYTTVDLFAEYRVTEAIRVTGRVLNLFDETYVEWATQTFGQNNLYFGNDRRFEAAVNVRF